MPTPLGILKDAVQLGAPEPLGRVQHLDDFMDACESAYWTWLMDSAEGNITRVAAECGLARSNVYKHMHRLGVL